MRSVDTLKLNSSFIFFQLIKVKRIMTEVLLDVTTVEINSVAKEELSRAKKKGIFNGSLSSKNYAFLKGFILNYMFLIVLDNSLCLIYLEHFITVLSYRFPVRPL